MSMPSGQREDAGTMETTAASFKGPGEDRDVASQLRPELCALQPPGGTLASWRGSVAPPVLGSSSSPMQRLRMGFLCAYWRHLDGKEEFTLRNNVLK